MHPLGRFTFAALYSLLSAIAVGQEAASSRYVEPYPQAASKKGLQVEMPDDAIELGIKHACLNINLCGLIEPQASPSSLLFTLDGQTYSFNRAYVERLDQDIKILSDHGVLVNVILLTYLSSDANINRILVHPNCIANPPNQLGAFNNRTDEGKAWITATLTFLAERWSRTDRSCGRVVGWIVGNEVNSHWWWSNMGEVTMERFADDYLETVRLVHRAVRSQSSSARVYLSLEHHWTIRYAPASPMQGFAAKPFLEYFAARTREQGDFDWHLAFHPYPENLFEPRFWKDKSATPREDSPRVTFRNLRVLTDYMNRDEMRFNGQPRRIIFSEQGFHTPDGPDGELIQAAAYCYAYKLIEGLDAVDAFILHRHVDHPHEGGLRLGLRWFRPGEADPRPKKLIYDCFQAADTPAWQAAFEFALPIVGLNSWDEAK